MSGFDGWVALLAAVVGYLAGALSFARVVGSRVAPGEDLGETDIEIGGSDVRFRWTAVSATTIMARMGPAYGCLTSILDMAKIALPALAFRLIYPDGYYHLIVAIAGIVGHIYPIYYRFKGGRGFSPLFGAILVIDPLGLPVVVVSSLLIGALIVRDLLTAYMGATVLLIPWLWFRTHSLPHVAFAVAATILLFVAMYPDIRQYASLKRAGEFDRGKLFDTGHTEMVREFLRRRGLLRDRPAGDE
jgi:acyl phosphate:glycerol-3-phosphate acyltransferase